MKLLKPSEYTALKNKADGYDAIISAIVSKNDNVTAEDITADNVIELLNATGDEDPQDPATTDPVTDPSEDTTNQDPADPEEDTDADAKPDLQAQLDEANATIAAQQEEINSFNAAPAAEPAAIAPKSEPGAKSEDIAAFADKNAGDTHAILNRMKEEGII